MARVSTEQLVSSVARQRHRDMLARDARDKVGGNLRRIGQWFGVQPRELRNHVAGLLPRHVQLDMLGAQMAGYSVCVWRLVEFRFMEADRKCLDRATPLQASFFRSSFRMPISSRPLESIAPRSIPSELNGIAIAPSRAIAITPP